MLHAISWKEYFTLMGLGLGFYYGWWLVRYYRGLKVGARGKADRGQQILPEFAKAERPVTAAAAEAIGKPDQAIPAEPQGKTQETLPMPVAPVTDGGAFLPMLAGELSAELQRLMKKACEERMVEGELVFAIGQLLNRPPYNRLKGTHLEGKIGAQIVRELVAYGSIHYDTENVKSWWK
jgi:hypothetical protein